MATTSIHTRKSPRRQFQRPVGILLGGTYFLCRSWQVGEGGMLVSGLSEEALGHQVVVTFTIPGKAYVVVRADVRYQSQSKIEGHTAFGLQFLNLPFEQKRVVRHFIASRVEADMEITPDPAKTAHAKKAV